MMPFINKPDSSRDLTIFNPNGVKTLLANGLSTFSIKDNPGFSNDPKSQPKNSPECPEFLITLY